MGINFNDYEEIHEVDGQNILSKEMPPKEMPPITEEMTWAVVEAIRGYEGIFLNDGRAPDVYVGSESCHNHQPLRHNFRFDLRNGPRFYEFRPTFQEAWDAFLEAIQRYKRQLNNIRYISVGEARMKDERAKEIAGAPNGANASLDSGSRMGQSGYASVGKRLIVPAVLALGVLLGTVYSKEIKHAIMAVRSQVGHLFN